MCDPRIIKEKPCQLATIEFFKSLQSRPTRIDEVPHCAEFLESHMAVRASCEDGACSSTKVVGVSLNQESRTILLKIKISH